MSYRDIHFLRDKAFAIKRTWLALGSQEAMDQEQAAVESFFRAFSVSSATLKWKKWAPEEAAKNLIGFSNTTEYEPVAKAQASIRKRLGLPPEI